MHKWPQWNVNNVNHDIHIHCTDQKIISFHCFILMTWRVKSISEQLTKFKRNQRYQRIKYGTESSIFNMIDVVLEQTCCFHRFQYFLCLYNANGYNNNLVDMYFSIHFSSFAWWWCELRSEKINSLVLLNVFSTTDKFRK